MLIALTVLLMASIVAISALQSSDTDVGIAGNFKAKVQSFYIAEAGVEMAYGVMRDTITWRTGFSDHPFANGSFDVRIVDSSAISGLIDTLIVYSTGHRSEAVTELEVWFATQRPFGWAAFGDERMKVCGTSMTDSFDSDSGTYATTHRNEMGNVGSNGYLDICGTADVNGDALTSTPGQIDIAGTAFVNGDTSSTSPAVIMDPVSDADMAYAEANSNAPAGLSGGFSYNIGSKRLRVLPGQTLTLADGIYYFTELDINGNVQIAPGAQVEIYLRNDASFGSQAKVNLNGKPANLMLFSVGTSITIAGGAEIWSVFYCPDTEIRLTGGADMYGAFIGNVADDVGRSSFHYDRSLGDLTRKNSLEKIAWRQL